MAADCPPFLTPLTPPTPSHPTLPEPVRWSVHCVTHSPCAVHDVAASFLTLSHGEAGRLALRAHPDPTAEVKGCSQVAAGPEMDTTLRDLRGGPAAGPREALQGMGKSGQRAARADLAWRCRLAGAVKRVRWVFPTGADN